MNIYKLIIFILAISIRLFGQDTLYFKNKTTVVVKIVEINSAQLKYKRFDNLDGPLFVTEKKDIEYVVYKTGLREVFDANPNSTVATNETQVKTEINQNAGNFTNAKVDARRYYKTNGLPVVTGFVAACNPLFGLIPAVIYSSTEIKPKNLNMPNPNAKSFEYKLTYEREAEKMKRSRTWTAYGIGAGINVTIIIVYIAAVLSGVI